MTTAKFLVRNAIPSDAKHINQYLLNIFSESRHLVTRAEEFRMRPFRQRLWIARKQSNPFETCLLATHDNTLIGMLENWTDRRARVKHVTTFSMSVAPEWQNQGVGYGLLSTFIKWVYDHNDLQKIELHAHSDNAAAIHLYEKTGFIVEGKRKDAIKYEDGRSVDDILMAYWPNSSNVEIDMEP